MAALAVLLTFAPGLSELGRDAAHHVRFDHCAWSAEHHDDRPNRSEERNCHGPVHRCPCHTSQLHVLAERPELQRPRPPARTIETRVAALSSQDVVRELVKPPLG